jgi:hypothetical protein
MVLDGASGSLLWRRRCPRLAEWLKGHIDVVAANGIRWGTKSALVAALSHFPELGPELLVLGSGRNVDLMEDQVDAF